MFRTLAIALTCSVVFCSVTSRAAERIGEAYAIAGSVSGQVNPDRPRALAPGNDVHFREHIRAHKASNGQFSFIDGSHFVVGPGGDVVLDDFVYRGGTAAATMKLVKGTMRFIGASARSGRDKIKIVTPIAVVGIRGTAVDVSHTAGRTAFLLLHGSADVCQGGTCRYVATPCSVVVVGSRVSGVRTPEPVSLAQDFPLLAQQNELWPAYRAPTTCGVQPEIQPHPRGTGKASDHATTGGNGGTGGY